MSTGWSHSKSLCRAGVAVGLTVALIACAANEPHEGEGSLVGGRETVDVPAPDRSVPSTTTTDDRSSATVVDVAPPAPPSGDVEGDVEVAVAQHLPRLGMRWTDAQLDVPDGELTSIGFMFAGFLSGEMWVVGQSSATPERQALLTWRSTDGTTWTRTDQLLDADIWVHTVLIRGDQLVAVGNRQDGAGPELRLLGTDASGVWQSIDLGAAIDTEGLMAWMQASNGEGVVLVAERVDAGAYGSPPLTIDIGDHRLVLDEAGGSYTLIDLRTSDVVASGPTSDIYLWTAEGQAVWRLDTRELLTVVPRDVWEEALTARPLLPIPVPEPIVTPRTIEWDGYRVVIDDANGRVEVTELTTGQLIQSTSHEEFYRGPPPQFRDDTSGEPLWSPTWAEWDQLLQSAYEQQDDPPTAAEAQRLLLVSPDGADWSEVEIGFGVGGAADQYVESLWSVPGGYQLVVAEYGMGQPDRRLYRSRDGIEWTSVELQVDQMMVTAPATGPQGVVAVRTDEMGYGYPTLTTSADGIAWTPEFQLGAQDDGRHAWFELLASGRTGHAAIATLVPQGPPEPLTITIGDLTARFDEGEFEFESAVTITDRDGDVVLTASRHELEMAIGDDRDPIATYADGVTTLWSTDGSPVMQIPDAAVLAAYEQRHQANVDRTDRVLFLERGDTWYEVAIPATGDEHVQLLAVGDDTVVVGVGQWGEPAFDCCEGGAGLTSMRVLVGHVDDAR